MNSLSEAVEDVVGFLPELSCFLPNLALQSDLILQLAVKCVHAPLGLPGVESDLQDDGKSFFHLMLQKHPTFSDIYHLPCTP